MRRQHFAWTYLVLTIVLLAYGSYSVLSSINSEKPIPTLGLVFFIVGAALLTIFVILVVITFFQRRKNPVNKETVANNEKEEEPPVDEEKPQAEEKPQVEEEAEEPDEEEFFPMKKSAFRDDTVYERGPASRRSYGGTAYIRKVGYGNVLRVTGEEILDMRNNTYYRIEGGIVKRNGSGPVFEISGNRIRSAFGSYLYEISGGRVNKVFGGYYASFDDGSLQVYDLSERYEISGSLSLKQKLAVVALLFGTY